MYLKNCLLVERLLSGVFTDGCRIVHINRIPCEEYIILNGIEANVNICKYNDKMFISCVFVYSL